MFSLRFPCSQSVQVKKIVTGQFDLFHSMYKPFLEEYEAKKLLKLSSTVNHQIHVSQVFIIFYLCIWESYNLEYLYQHISNLGWLTKKVINNIKK
jgi:translocator assembly and maintenance protein 41